MKAFLDKVSERLKTRVIIAAAGAVFGKSNKELLKVVYDPDEFTGDRLDEIFNTDANKKMLLKIPDMAKRAIHDMRAQGRELFDQDNFSAVKHVVTLAKLSLESMGTKTEELERDLSSGRRRNFELVYAIS